MQNVSSSNLTAAVDNRALTRKRQQMSQLYSNISIGIAAIGLPSWYAVKKRAQSDVRILGLAGSFERLCNSWTTTHTQMTEENRTLQREGHAVYAQLQREANAQYSQLQAAANATFAGMRAEVRQAVSPAKRAAAAAERSAALQQAIVTASIRSRMRSGLIGFMDHVLWQPYNRCHELRIPVQYFDMVDAVDMPRSFVPDMEYLVPALRPDGCENPRSIQHVYRAAVTAFALWLHEISDDYIGPNMLAWGDLPFLGDWLRDRFGWRAGEPFNCEHPTCRPHPRSPGDPVRPRRRDEPV
jgi:hypothetical protein